MTGLDLDLDNLDTDGDIGLGDEDKGKVNSNQLQWYKGEKNRTDRVALVFFNDIRVSALRKALRSNPGMSKDQQREVVIKVLKAVADKLGKSVDQLDSVDTLDQTEARFKTLSSSYKQGIGYVEWPKKLTVEEEKVWKKLGEKKDYVVTLLLVYPTDKEGSIDKERLSSHWKLLPWRFPPKIYDAIRKINKGQAENDTSVAAVDLMISCEDAQYQKLTITAAGPCIYRKSEAFRRLILENAIPMYEKLNPFRQLTTDELKEKLGMGGGGGGRDDDGGDFTNILGNV